MQYKKNIIKFQAFTLAELIVIITIATILITLGFMAYNGYSLKARDVNRVTNITSVGKGLEVYKLKKGLPMPEDKIDIYSSGELIAYQGYVGKDVLKSIDFNNNGLDPLDQSYFSYYITKSKKYFEIMTFLEEKPDIVMNIPTKKTFATDYSVRYPLVYGNKLGILTDDKNVPLQGVSSFSKNGFIDLATATGYYIAHFKNDGSLLGTGDDLSILKDLAENGGKPNSCLAWIIMNPDLLGEDGIYQLTDAQGESYAGFCDWTPPENIAQYKSIYGTGLIDNGSFEGGLWPEKGSPSSQAGGNNKKKAIQNPTGETYVLYQGASWQSSYDIELKPEHLPLLQKDDILRMTARVADLNEDGYIFHNIIDYNDGSNSVNGEVHTVETQTIDGRVWIKQYVDHFVEKTPTNFIWHLGYNAETSPKKFYATGLEMEIFRAQ